MVFPTFNVDNLVQIYCAQLFLAIRDPGLRSPCGAGSPLGTRCLAPPTWQELCQTHPPGIGGTVSQNTSEDEIGAIV